jgi:hypothetical protein
MSVSSLSRALLLLTIAMFSACATLKRGYEAACLEACRAEGGAAQGTSRCERGCRTRR